LRRHYTKRNSTRDNDIANAKFYFNYGANGQKQAGLYEKAADLLRKSIAPRSGELGGKPAIISAIMWADHNMNLDEAEIMIKTRTRDGNRIMHHISIASVGSSFRTGKFDQALNNLLSAAKDCGPR